MTAGVEVDGMLTTVVRGWGYDVRHVVTVPLSSVLQGLAFGVTFDALRAPIVARCGARVRTASTDGAVVIMEVGTAVTCRPCRAFSGVERQTGPCRWFALCPNTAAGVVQHPVLGRVPCCDRCRSRATADEGGSSS